MNPQKAWRKATEAAGLGGKLMHDFQRTAVRNMVRAGISERVAMRITGHKTRSVFDRYDVGSSRDLAEAAEKLDLAGNLDFGHSLVTLTPSRTGGEQPSDRVTH